MVRDERKEKDVILMMLMRMCTRQCSRRFSCSKDSKRHVDASMRVYLKGRLTHRELEEKEKSDYNIRKS